VDREDEKEGLLDLERDLDLEDDLDDDVLVFGFDVLLGDLGGLLWVEVEVEEVDNSIGSAWRCKGATLASS